MDLWKSILDLVRDRQVLIAGFGREGQSTYRLLRDRLPEQTLHVGDRNPSNEALGNLRTDPKTVLHTGETYLRDLEAYDLVIKAPGIPPSEPGLAAARPKITSQTDLFLRVCPGTVVGITGTKGKSTCASLTFALLKARHADVHLLGNIGRPALDDLDRLTPDSIVVYELSSHQLADVHNSPGISILLNIYSEHLDYYADMDSYVRAKTNIAGFAGPGDILIYNDTFEELRRAARESAARGIPYSPEDAAGTAYGKEASPGCFVASGTTHRGKHGGNPPKAGEISGEGNDSLYLREGEDVEPIVSVRDLPLPGRFNLNNVIPAVIAARLLGVPVATIREAIKSFKPLEHRLEFVGKFKDLEFYDDSISTIPECTMAALEHFAGRVGSLILGGHDRKNDYHGLAESILEHRPDVLILFPGTGDAMLRAFEEEGGADAPEIRAFRARDMEEAVILAYKHTPRGKICLLSPASPSFGLFKDFADRGSQFKRRVRALGGISER
jgi:UDP-N-acetylmuramoylalanine--D-glutamate ligase